MTAMYVTAAQQSSKVSRKLQHNNLISFVSLYDPHAARL